MSSTGVLTHHMFSNKFTRADLNLELRNTRGDDELVVHDFPEGIPRSSTDVFLYTRAYMSSRRILQVGVMQQVRRCLFLASNCRHPPASASCCHRPTLPHHHYHHIPKNTSAAPTPSHQPRPCPHRPDNTRAADTPTTPTTNTTIPVTAIYDRRCCCYWFLLCRVASSYLLVLTSAYCTSTLTRTC